MYQINIITQLLAFFIFAIAVNFLKLKALFITLAIVATGLLWVKNHQFFRLIRRLKWFYFVMFLIFSLNTPGEYLASWPFSIAPTYEGIQEGLSQLLRISAMLAVLSFLLASNTRSRLMSGLYFLLFPLKILGLDIERFTARLWLTLHYVELQQKAPKNPNIMSNLGNSLSAIFKENGHEEISITLEKPVFTWLDFILIVFMLGLLFLMLKASA